MKVQVAPQYELPGPYKLEIASVPLKTTKAFERGLEGLEIVAPRAGVEPATSRLTAGCSTTELPGNETVRRRAAYSSKRFLLGGDFFLSEQLIDCVLSATRQNPQFHLHLRSHRSGRPQRMRSEWPR